MDTLQVKTAFIRLKPMCDTFLNSPSKTTLAPLIDEYKKLQSNLLQEIHAYLLFPYTIHLRNPKVKSTELKMAMVDAMYEIFLRTRVDSIDMYLKYLTLMSVQKFEKDPDNSSSFDEDFALSVVRVILILTLRIPNNLRLKLYARCNVTKLGQIIFVCLQFARKQQYKPLRIASMHCILAICSLHDNLMEVLHFPKINKKYAECVGDVLMFFLPGIVGGMQEIAAGDQKQGHVITRLALKVINRVLCLTLMDKEEPVTSDFSNEDFVKLVKSNAMPENENSDPFGAKLRAKGVDGIKEHLEKAERSKEWYAAAADKLTLLIRSLLSVQVYPHERVRMESAIMCSDIITYCSRNMAPSMRYILEMLIILSEDDASEVRQVSRKALDNFTENCSSSNRRQLSDILEENFSNALTKVFRHVNKIDVNVQLCGIHLLRGYIRLLSNPVIKPQSLTKILSCTHVMNRFSIILVEIFKLECSRIKLLDECTVRDVENPTINSEPWKVYKYLQNKTSINNATNICKILGASDSAEIIIDYLLEQYRLNNEYKKEIILILNEILAATCEVNDSKDHLVKSVILMYVDYENWYLPTEVKQIEKLPGKNETFDVSIYNPREWIKQRTHDLYEGATETRYTDISYKQEENNFENYYEDKDSCRTLMEAQNNVVQICLMTEGIGKVAKAMKSRFQSYLLRILYLILERAGSSIEAIHLAGINALHDIANAFNLKDITELIKFNADYFTHHVNVKLKKIADNVGVLDVLLVVMKYSEAEILPCLFEIVKYMLDQCYMTNIRINISLFLKLFYTFVKYIGCKFPPENKDEGSSNVKKCPENCGILCSLKEFKNNLDIIQKMDENDNTNGVENHEMYDHLKNLNREREEQESPEEFYDTVEEKEAPPAHIKMIEHVLKKTINFLPSNNQEEKVLALDIINEGIVIIKDYEDELLPLVHQIWAPLVTRFKEISHPLIINRSFRLLVTLARISKDFIRVRTLKEVMPSICEFLSKSSKDSMLKDVGSAYRFTQAYKLQLTVLENLAVLCISLRLEEKNLNEILRAVQGYLSQKQPKPLQEACVNFFIRLAAYDVGSCWLQIHSLWNDNKKEVRFEDFDKSGLNLVSFPVVDNLEAADYKRNVCTIMEHLEKI